MSSILFIVCHLTFVISSICLFVVSHLITDNCKVNMPTLRVTFQITHCYMCFACVFVYVCFTPSDGSWRIFIYERSPPLCVTIETAMSPMFGEVSVNHLLSSDWSPFPKVILAWLTNKLFNWLIKTSLDRDCEDMNTHLNTVLLACLGFNGF